MTAEMLASLLEAGHNLWDGLRHDTLSPRWRADLRCRLYPVLQRIQVMGCQSPLSSFTLLTCKGNENSWRHGTRCRAPHRRHAAPATTSPAAE